GGALPHEPPAGGSPPPPGHKRPTRPRRKPPRPPSRRESHPLPRESLHPRRGSLRRRGSRHLRRGNLRLHRGPHLRPYGHPPSAIPPSLPRTRPPPTHSCPCTPWRSSPFSRAILHRLQRWWESR